MTIDLDQLPHLSELFERLRSGRHLCEEDDPLFSALHSRQESFAALFGALGFDLVKHDRGFYYFRAEAELGKEASALAVFFFVLVEAWSDAGQDIGETIFAPAGHRCSDLPHFKRESWKQCMAEAGIETDAALNDLVRRMKGYGFTDRIDDDRFRFRTPVWRFLDLCNDIWEENAAATRAAEPTANPGNQESL